MRTLGPEFLNYPAKNASFWPVVPFHCVSAKGHHRRSGDLSEMSWPRGQAYAQHLRDRVLAAIDRGMAAYEAAVLFRSACCGSARLWRVGVRKLGATAGQPSAAQTVGYYEATRLKLKAALI
jgi:hypothetical protein